MWTVCVQLTSVALLIAILLSISGLKRDGTTDPSATRSVEAEPLRNLLVALEQKVDQILSNQGTGISSPARKHSAESLGMASKVLTKLEEVQRQLAALAAASPDGRQLVRDAARSFPLNRQELYQTAVALSASSGPTAEHGMFLTPLGVIRIYGAPTSVSVDRKGNPYWEYQFKGPDGKDDALTFFYAGGLVVDVVR